MSCCSLLLLLLLFLLRNVLRIWLHRPSTIPGLLCMFHERLSFSCNHCISHFTLCRPKGSRLLSLNSFIFPLPLFVFYKQGFVSLRVIDGICWSPDETADCVWRMENGNKVCCLYKEIIRAWILTHCGRVTQICVFNTVKLGTSASSP